MTNGSAAWYLDRSYLERVWQDLHRGDRLSLDRLRDYLEGTFDVTIMDDFAIRDPHRSLDAWRARNADRRTPMLMLAVGDGDDIEEVRHLTEHPDVAVILIGTADTMSRELRVRAEHVVELDRIADEIATRSLVESSGLSRSLGRDYGTGSL